MKKKYFILLPLLLLFFGAGYFIFKEASPKISEGATKTIEVMTTGPNRKLYNPEPMLSIGLGHNPTQAEKDKAKAASDERLANWEELLGEYYAPGCLDGFVTGFGWVYLAKADSGSKITLESTTLEKKTDSYEIVLLELTVDDVPETLRLSFSHDENGLINRIDTLPLKES